MSDRMRNVLNDRVTILFNSRPILNSKYECKRNAVACPEKLGWGGGGRHKVISQHVITKSYLIESLFEVIIFFNLKYFGEGGTPPPPPPPANMGATAMKGISK